MADTALTQKAVNIIDESAIKVWLLRSDKFKTNSISIFFHDNLNRKHAALNALLPMVLRRGTQELPTLQSVSAYLEELYGASFDCGINKKGESHIMFYYIEAIKDAYTMDNSSIISKAFKFISDVLLNPVTQEGMFNNDYVAQEKDNLKRLIASRVNDKRRYATDRCYEEMCANERFGIYEYGNIENVDCISNSALYSHYNTVLQTMPINIFIVGDTDEETIMKMFHRYFDSINSVRNNIISPVTDSIYKDVTQPRKVFETMDVNQGKLCLGLRTNTSASDEDYYALVLCNGILGGGVHSKLFRNVREKASLAYYAYSRLERFKALMLIGSGIEIDNYDKATDIILKQIDEIKAGNISDFEYDSTVKSLETGLKSMMDSHVEMVDFSLSQSISGNNIDPDEFIQKIKQITKQQIVNVAHKIKLDTIYFLTNK